MSNIEQIDFSTLTWVKTELDETLNRAKEALKAYVEDSEDTNQLQFCVTYLHQIQGTLKMVELYGAAMVAEEMEWVAKDLIDGKINDEDAAYDVLMQSILQLPDYLERIELGHKDVPIVLLPLVNDLRSVRSQKLLSESALFNPNLDLGVPERVLKNDVSLKGNQLKTALLKIRSVYQIALLNWIKQKSESSALNNMQLVISKLQMILSPDYLKQLFWAFSGVVEGLINKEIDDNVSIKQIAGQVDHLIKELIDQSSHIKSSSRSLTRNMLYYIAISEESGRIGSEIKSFFNLSQFIPDQEEVKHAEGSLSGKNKELLQTVSDAINDDVLVVQESLDLFIRNKSAQVDELKPLLDNLQKIGDTLGILGLGVARDSVLLHQGVLKTSVEESQRPTDDQLLDVAKTLLMIESQLGDHIQSLGVSDEVVGDEETAIPKSEKRAILQQLAKESIINLQQIKTNFVAFIESPWDKKQVEDNPRLLKDISGAMKILNLSEAGEHLDAIIAYVNTDILGSESKPSAMQLEQLATVISSLEYYLENLDQGQKIRQSLLSEVDKQIQQLQQQVAEDVEAHAAEPVAEEPAVEEPASSEATATEVEETTEDSAAEESSASEDTDDQEVVEETAETVEEQPAEAVETPTAEPVLMVDFGDDVDEEIKEVFLEEFEEELANMQHKHEKWQQDPEAHAEELTEIRRIFHTLKGSGRLVGAEAIGEFGWMLENMCNRLLDGGIENDNNFKTVLSSGVTMAAGLFSSLQENASVPDGYSLLLKNAENVANGAALEEAAPVVTVSEPVPEEVAVEEVTEETADAVAEVSEEAEVLTETVDLSDETEETDSAAEAIETADAEPEVAEEAAQAEELELVPMDESTESDADEVTEDEALAIDADAAESTEEPVEASTAEESEAADEDDLSLDFVLDDEDKTWDAADEETAEPAAEGNDEAELDLSDLDLGMPVESDLSMEFEADEEEITETDTADESEQEVAAASGALNELVDDIELSESEEIDLEAELAAFDAEEDLLEVGDSDSGDEAADEGITLDVDEDFNLEDFGFDTEETETVEEADKLDLEGELTAEEAQGLMDFADADETEGVSETTSEDEALEVDPVFIEILQKEVGGHLNEMAQFVSDSLEREQPQVNDDFVRVVHTLNGAASMASVDGITKMTTPLEKMSIMLMDRKQNLSPADLDHIEQMVRHARSQLNLLGTGTVPVDDSIGDYFTSRIDELNEVVEAIKDAEDLAVETNLLDEVDLDLSDEVSVDESADQEVTTEEAVAEEAEAIEEEVAEEEVVEEEVAEEEVAEEEVAEEEVAEEEVAEEEVAEEAVAEEEVAEEAVAEEEVAEEEVAEEAVAEEAVAEEAAAEEVPEEPAMAPFAQMGDADEGVSTADVSELELDEELLEIFGEEASEIFDRADHLLAELEEKPKSPAIIQALQRDLHTLKGGARMAGLNQIGDLSHQLESLFESIAEKDLEVSPNQHEMMSQVMHKLHGMVNADDYGMKTSIEEETKQLENMLSSEGAEIKEKSKLDEEFFDPLAQVDTPLEESQADEVDQTTVAKKKANVLSGGQIKVNSELLDKLVNFAGEVSIYRSRMEQQSAELKLNIDELENTVERVRRQLRELEHETEAQIISNYQLEGDELEEDFDPLELDQFSTIQQLSRSLSESVSDLTNIQSYLQESARSSETLLIQQSRVNTELQEGLMETRLVTFNSLVPRLRRVLRTAAQELDKKAKLVVKGAEGEMDKTVLEGIQAPLEHMIRNAMVHGLEDDRNKADKPEQGQVVIELSREATEVVITVKDDGAGINTDVLKEKAITRGIIDKDAKMSEHDIAQLIIHSGLSAADKVTKLAGRGVGMDVVNNEIKRLGGSIEIISETGVGTTFVIRLPYTLALTQAIIVQVADHRYAIPASGVQGLIRMNIDEFRRRILENDLGYDYAGEQYQIQELNKLLAVDSEAMVEGNQVPLVMIKSGDQGVALRVDQTYGGREIVVKSVGTQVASVPGIFGATILGDGAVVLILDIIPMHRAYLQKLEKLEAEGVQVFEEVEEDKVTTIMVVDDSITMRRAGERMLTRNEFEVMTAKDGLDALNKLQEQKPDLMLLDIEMPRMDGFELATNMKQSDKFKDIPIIMITSRTGQKHKDRAKEIGVERYLGKPYQEIELLENIKDLLQLEDA